MRVKRHEAGRGQLGGKGASHLPPLSAGQGVLGGEGLVGYVGITVWLILCLQLVCQCVKP